MLYAASVNLFAKQDHNFYPAVIFLLFMIVFIPVLNVSYYSATFVVFVFLLSFLSFFILVRM